MGIVRGIDWDGNGHSNRRSGRIENQEVAVIHKNKNHTHSNDGIWSVEVFGEISHSTFRYVKDAQEHAADLFFKSQE